MHGVGRVFAMFSSGELEDDDEVAVVHSPPEDGSRPLSEAMVNLRMGLNAAAAESIIDRQTAVELIQATKCLFYPDRSWPAVYSLAPSCGASPDQGNALREFVHRTTPDIKGADAVELLSHLASIDLNVRERDVPTFTFEPTYNWNKLVSIIRSRRSAEALGNHLGVDANAAFVTLQTGRPDLLATALLDHLVQQEALRLGLTDSTGAPVCDVRLAREILLTRHKSELYAHLVKLLHEDGLVDLCKLDQGALITAGAENGTGIPLPDNRTE
jgi:hypothetical protein